MEKVCLRADRAEKSMNHYQAKLEESERKREDLLADLSSAREEGRKKYEERLAADLARYREHNEREVAGIRESARAIYAREADALREAKDLAVGESERLREQLRLLTIEHEQLVMQHSKSESNRETMLAELRSEAKMKAFELSQLGVTHEARMQDLRDAQLRIQSLDQQVRVHEAEFRRLEASSHERIAQLESKVTDQQKTIEMYEGLEIELDSAVLRAGSSDVERGSVLRAEGDELALLSAATGSGRERRVRQTVHLAKQLLKREREVSELQEHIGEKSRCLEGAQSRIRELEFELDSVKQPKRYVLEELQKRQEEIERLQAECFEANASISRVKAQLRHSEATRSRIEKEMESLVSHRDEIQGLRIMIEALKAASEAKLSHTPPPLVEESKTEPFRFESSTAHIAAADTGLQVASSRSDGSAPRSDSSPHTTYLSPDRRQPSSYPASPAWFQRNAE